MLREQKDKREYSQLKHNIYIYDMYYISYVLRVFNSSPTSHKSLVLVARGEEAALRQWPVLRAAQLGPYLQAEPREAPRRARGRLPLRLADHRRGPEPREREELGPRGHPWGHALLLL